MLPLFKFGLIADVQYGNFDNRMNYERTKFRYYRNSLKVLQRAVDVWNNAKVDFAIQMGDLIDGFNAVEFNSTESAYANVMSTIREKAPLLPLFHVIGNHELYNFARKDLSLVFPHPENYNIIETYDSRNSRTAHFQPSENVAIVIVDNYEFSLLGCPEQSIYSEAKDFLMARNPNHYDLNAPDGLNGTDARFCMYSGAVSQEQLDWLESILKHADDNDTSVVVAGHLPIHPEACDPGTLEWRYEEFLNVLQRHPSVVAYMAGHNHDGGYACDSFGIHHITFQGAIEAPPKVDCFATVSVYSDRFEVTGYGKVPSRICYFRTKHRPQRSIYMN